MLALKSVASEDRTETEMLSVTWQYQHCLQAVSHKATLTINNAVVYIAILALESYQSQVNTHIVQCCKSYGIADNGKWNQS